MDTEKLHMTHSLLREITDDFADERILGRGRFGVVYKGIDKDGQELAVKVLYSKGVDDEQFQRELKNLTKLKHQNIVPLLGFCNETEQVTVEFEGKQIIAQRIHRALCYQYMHNGSLHKYLFEEDHGFGWHKRYRIIKGICEGLKYLQEGLDTPIYHLDLKPGNVLLDMNMVPKISDFALSRLLDEGSLERIVMDVGTHGYIPPEYIENHVISKEFDVFSLGVIIIKIIIGPMGHASIGNTKAAEFIENVWRKWRERLDKEPESTIGEIDCQQVKKCIEIALMCINKKMKERPTIAYLVEQLNQTEAQQSNPEYSIKEVGDQEVISSNSNIPAKFSPEMESDTSGGKTPKNNRNLRGTLLPHEQPLEYFKKLTDGFSQKQKLSEDAFGTIYKGILQDGQVIAVKKLVDNIVFPAGKHFLKEVTNLTLVQHENLLNLISFCSEAKETVLEHNGQYIFIDTYEYVLCYEYTPNGSLCDYLTDDANITDWVTHFKIIKGICQGLHSLHEKVGGPILHMDLKPANILLDANMIPKIANFGLSRLLGQEQTEIRTENVVGSKGYMAPEYLYSGEISPQCDIYSLGVLMMEITTREKNCPNDNDMAARNFISLIRKTWTDEHIASKYSSLDPDDIQDVKTCIDIGLKCVDVAQKNRPSIVEVVNEICRRRGI